MLSTMQDHPLTISDLFHYGRTVHGHSRVATFTGEHTPTRHATFAAIAERADRLASALTRLGVQPGDRVATFSWNSQEHLEIYFAVPSMGAVLHTLNIRLFPEQLAYVIIRRRYVRIVGVDHGQHQDRGRLRSPGRQPGRRPGRQPGRRPGPGTAVRHRVRGVEGQALDLGSQ